MLLCWYRRLLCRKLEENLTVLQYITVQISLYMRVEQRFSNDVDNRTTSLVEPKKHHIQMSNLFCPRRLFGFQMVPGLAFDH